MILRALLLRPLVRRPWWFLVTLVGVAAGVAAVVSTLAASRAAIAAFGEGVEEVAGAARLELTRPGGLPEELLVALRPVTGEAVVVPIVEESVLLVELGDGVRLLGVDLLLDARIRPEVQEETDPADLEPMITGFGTVMTRSLAEELGIEPGQSFDVLAGGRLASLELAATFTPDRAGSAWERTLVMDVAAAQEVLGRRGRLDRIELMPRRGVELPALRARVDEILPADTRLAEPSRRRESAEQMVASLRFNLLALSAISVLVGGVLVATTLATSVVQRRYVLSLLRSMGASRRQVATAIAVEALGIGLIGGLLGVAAGFFGARAALTSVRFTIAAVLRGVPATDIRFEPWLAGFGILLAIGTALCAAILPLAEVVATPPVQGLRSAAPQPRLGARSRRRSLALLLGMLAAAALLTQLPAWGDLPLAALGAALLITAALLVGSGVLLDALARAGHGVLAPLPTVALRLASAALAAGRRRASWATGAVAVAVALAVAIATLVTSFRTTVVQWTDSGLRADLWIRPLTASTGVAVGQLDPELVEVAERLFGADRVDPFYSVTIQYRGRPVSFAGGAFEVAQRGGGVPFPGRDSREVFAEALRRRGLMVNEPFANRFGVGEGDRIRLRLPGGTLEREVSGVFQDFSRSHGLIVADRSDFLTHFPDRGPDDVTLFLPPDADVAAARKRLLEAVRGRFMLEVLDNRELKKEVLAVFERTFAITTALYLVAAAVAVVAVTTVLLTLVGERRRELATVRAIGGSRWQLTAMVVAQAGLLGIAAAAAGSAAGLAIGVILVKVVNLQSFGWSLELVLPWSSLLQMAAWVVLGCLIAGIAPALAAARLQPAEVLREDR